MQDKMLIGIDPNPALATADLLRRARRGEEAAFKAIFDLLKRRIYSISLIISRSEEAAAQLTSGVFLTVFRQADAFDDPRELTSRVEALAVRRAVAWRRESR